MKVLVFGAGALGQWLGALLARSGADTTLVVRPRSLEALRLGGIRLDPAEAPAFLRVVARLEDLPPEARTCDWLVLAVKAFDVEGALAGLQAGAVLPDRVLAIQNGLGTDGAVARAFGASRTFVGSVTRAVGVVAPGLLQPAAKGGLAVAPLAPGASAGDLLDRLAAQGLPVALEPDAAAVKWSKLLLNMVANASCAILDMLPGPVLGSLPLYALEIRAMREALRVMRRLGLPVRDLPGYPVRLLARTARSLPTWASFPVLGQRMAAGRGQKPPSLLLDLRAGRSRTEVEWMNGAVAESAGRLGLPAPLNRGLTSILREVASGRVPAEAFRNRPQALLQALAVESRDAGGRPGEPVEGGSP